MQIQVSCSRKSMVFGVNIPALPLAGSFTSDKLLNLPEVQFHHWQNEVDSNTRHLISTSTCQAQNVIPVPAFLNLTRMLHLRSLWATRDIHRLNILPKFTLARKDGDGIWTRTVYTRDWVLNHHPLLLIRPLYQGFVKINKYIQGA